MCVWWWDLSTLQDAVIVGSNITSQRTQYVIMTSLWRQNDVAKTMSRRRFDVTMTLFLRPVSVGMTPLQWLKQNMKQGFCPQKTHHTSLWWVSYGVFFVWILKKTDCYNGTTLHLTGSLLIHAVACHLISAKILHDVRPLGLNFIDIWIYKFWFKELHFKIPFKKCQLFNSGFNVLILCYCYESAVHTPNVLPMSSINIFV